MVRRGSKHAERNIEIVIQHLGLDGQAGLTLDVIARRTGLTRERVRQVCKSAVARMRKRSPETPVLASALRLAARSLPRPADEIEREIKLHGLSAVAFRLEGLLSAGSACGLTPEFEVQRLWGTRWAVPAGRVAAVRAISHVARDRVRRWGAMSMTHLAGELPRDARAIFEADFVRRALRCLPDFQWLDKRKSWFWFSGQSGNCAVRLIEKMLAVCGRLTVAELRAGMLETHAHLPPRGVLRAICGRLPWCVVDGDKIGLAQPIDWCPLLGKEEGRLIAALKEHGGPMRHEALETACVAGGMNPITFNIYLKKLPMLERLGPNVYGLRGSVSASPRDSASQTCRP
jgi:hypothetical protein